MSIDTKDRSNTKGAQKEYIELVPENLNFQIQKEWHEIGDSFKMLSSYEEYSQVTISSSSTLLIDI